MEPAKYWTVEATCVAQARYWTVEVKWVLQAKHWVLRAKCLADAKPCALTAKYLAQVQHFPATWICLPRGRAGLSPRRAAASAGLALAGLALAGLASLRPRFARMFREWRVWEWM